MNHTTRLALVLLLLVPAPGCGPAEAPATPARVAELPTLDLNREVTAADLAKFNPPRTTPREVVRTTLCGAATKTTGQPCRNKVRGGGPCWRHRG